MATIEEIKKLKVNDEIIYCGDDLSSDPGFEKNKIYKIERINLNDLYLPLSIINEDSQYHWLFPEEIKIIKPETYTVKIGGFKSKEAAQMFMSWYENAGENQIEVWKAKYELKNHLKFENQFLVHLKTMDDENLTMDLY